MYFNQNSCLEKHFSFGCMRDQTVHPRPMISVIVICFWLSIIDTISPSKFQDWLVCVVDLASLSTNWSNTLRICFSGWDPLAEATVKYELGCHPYSCKLTFAFNAKVGAQWLSGRVLDLRLRDRGFEPHRVLKQEHLSKLSTGSTQVDPSLYNWKFVDGM